MTTLTEPRTSSVPEVWLAPTTVMGCRQVVTRASAILQRAAWHFPRVLDRGDWDASTILIESMRKLEDVSRTLSALYHMGTELAAIEKKEGVTA